METHSDDPTTEPPVDPWTTFQQEFGELGEHLKSTYEKVASDDGPSEAEIKEALGTLAGAWNQVAGSVSSAFQDPEVRQRMRDAGSAFASALGRTITELGGELRDSTGWAPDQPAPADEEE